MEKPRIEDSEPLIQQDSVRLPNLAVTRTPVTLLDGVLQSLVELSKRKQ